MIGEYNGRMGVLLPLKVTFHIFTLGEYQTKHELYMMFIYCQYVFNNA